MGLLHQYYRVHASKDLSGLILLRINPRFWNAKVSSLFLSTTTDGLCHLSTSSFAIRVPT
jgi:hypothetical protein